MVLGVAAAALALAAPVDIVDADRHGRLDLANEQKVSGKPTPKPKKKPHRHHS